LARRRALTSTAVRATLLDVCIALAACRLPPYVLLEIVDRFRCWSTHVARKFKIDFIVDVRRSIDAVLAAHNVAGQVGDL
jgi:hypothetical protein